MTREERARADAVLLLGNLRTLVDEADAILQQADRFATDATWLPDLSRTEWQLEKITRAMAAAGGLVAKE